MLNYDLTVDELMNEYKKIRVPAAKRQEIRELLENPPEGENVLARLRDAAMKKAERYPRFLRIVRLIEG